MSSGVVVVFFLLLVILPFLAFSCHHFYSLHMLLSQTEHFCGYINSFVTLLKPIYTVLGLTQIQNKAKTRIPVPVRKKPKMADKNRDEIFTRMLHFYKRQFDWLAIVAQI